ncbi:hypothetical protein [Catalinimonas alkaloidigena]|uniref:hypothetical protein n=1 Tax=Catalinimonas alkaloidigena TaxID=1075417 RepID=UPI002404FF8F|nr:hypothetical protein [Catalinimonas alkaloidigena]
MGQNRDEQSITNSRSITLHSAVDSVRLDSLSIVPGSLQILAGDQILDNASYHYDYNTHYLHFHPDALPNEVTTIHYRLLPFSLRQTHAHKDISIYDSTAFFRDAVDHGSYNLLGREELFKTPKLYKSGSISRGISIGNRQNVFLNSSLNLQIEGELTDELLIRASITDQNIPVQPEGNTQQLQDFDNVYLELYNDDFSLLAGDIVLQQSGNQWLGNSRVGNALNTTQKAPYFLRYRRNVQGGRLTNNYSFSENSNAETEVGFAISKGKFTSVNLNIQEGVQGPYQINSPENRNTVNGNNQLMAAYFIIANSEKVYLDGRLLERGYNKDYTINYNLSEITFTSRVLLTRYSRVYIDYEYADRSFSRSVVTANHRQNFKRFSFYVSYFREKDNSNQALGFTLSEEDKNGLRKAGDQTNNAFVPAVDSAIHFQQQPQYQTNRNAEVPGVGNLYQIFYNRLDTVVNGTNYQIYEFSGKEGDFKVDFSFVGEGKGNYVLAGSAVNSKVYEWVPPVDGVQAGSYAPVRLVVAPQTQHMLVFGTETELSKKDQLKVEAAFSKNDINTLSHLDAEDNHGRGIFIQYSGDDRKLFETDYHWGSSISYEYRQKFFKEIDPYRTIEFERDWTLNTVGFSDTSSLYDDHNFTSRIFIEKDALNQFSYQWFARNNGEALAGIQHRSTANKSLGDFQFRGQAFFLQSNQYDKKSQWDRWSLDVHHRGKYIQPGYRYSVDKNQQHFQEDDSVVFSSMNFEEHLFYIRNADSLKGTFQLEYSLRKDFLPYQGKLFQSDLAQTLTASTDLPLNEKHQVSMQLAYRQLDMRNDSLFVESNISGGTLESNTLMGQLNWSGSMADGAIHTDLNYSLANGREPKREFVYIRVPVGEGAYTWRDDNGNGIEEIDEFYEARYFDERNYMRVFIPTNEFILAYTNNFNFQLNMTPPLNWLEKGGVKSWLGRFSTITAWSIDKRINAESITQRVIPWLDAEDESLLSIRENLRTTLFFNRRETSFGAELGFRNQRRKQLLNGGFEERIKQAVLIGTRWNINRQWGFKWQGEKGSEVQKLQLTQQNNRNFNINFFQIWPEISWQADMKTRVSAKYTYINKQNQASSMHEEGDDHAVHHTIGLDFRHTQLMKHNINASIEYIDIHYDGEINSALAYEMLDGLNSGSNVRWTINWQQYVLEGLQLVLNYYGRKSEEKPSIHSGSVMLRALF